MVPGEMFLDESLNAKERLVLAVLYFHRNQRTGECFPSLSRIARCSSLSLKTVKRTISSLEARGRLERKNRFSSSGDPDSNQYLLRGWGQADPTPDHTDPTVGSHRPEGWGQGDPLTKNTNREEEHTNPSSQSQVLDPKPKPRKSAHLETIKAAFGEVWRLYPKKQGKKAAFEAFSGLFPAAIGAERLNQRFQNVCGQATLYAESVKSSEQKFIKLPENWLRSIDPDEEATIEEETWVREEGDE